jgi:hypothetical protein
MPRSPCWRAHQGTPFRYPFRYAKRYFPYKEQKGTPPAIEKGGVLRARGNKSGDGGELELQPFLDLNPKP